MADEKRNIQYYLLKSGLGDGMYAKVRHNQPYTERKFIEMMCKNDPELEPDMVKRVMKVMMETGVEALQLGMPLIISNFLRIYPTIKGGFTGTDDGFDKSRHTLNFKTSLAQSYVDSVVKGLVIEKIERPKGIAEISRIENIKTGANELTKFFTNRLVGMSFLISGHKLKGIKLTNADNLEEEVKIGVENLDIPSHTLRELSFSIAYNYELPDWLVDGLPLYLDLLYISDDEGDDSKKKPQPSHSFSTVWKVI